MPTGIRYATIVSDNLPRQLGQKCSVNQQLNIWGEEEYDKNGIIEYLGKSEYGNYDKFKITYWVLQRVTGYYKEYKVDSLLVTVQNFFYISSDQKYILVRAPKKAVEKILNLLEEGNYLKCSEKLLDLKAFREKLAQEKDKIKSVVGAWITNVESVNVNTIAIFGSEIDQSDEFDDYASQDSSTISELIIDIGEEIIAITNKYGAIFYNRRSEEKVLEGYSIVIGLLSKFDMF